MKAVLLREYGGPGNLKLEDNVADPQVSGNTVLISTAAASVNPIDWKLRSGVMQKNFPLSLPAILGRDVSGIVRTVGPNVKHFKPGDRVMALSWATYAELVAVEDSQVTHLPEGLAPDRGGSHSADCAPGDQLVRRPQTCKRDRPFSLRERSAVWGAPPSIRQRRSARKCLQVFAERIWRGLVPWVSPACWPWMTTAAIQQFHPVDAIADTVGGDVAV